jgi:hypothetical protein
LQAIEADPANKASLEEMAHFLIERVH